MARATDAIAYGFYVNSDIFNDQTRRNQINLELNQCGSKRDVSWTLKLKTMTNRNLPSTTMISNADRWSRDILDRSFDDVNKLLLRFSPFLLENYTFWIAVSVNFNSDRIGVNSVCYTLLG